MHKTLIRPATIYFIRHAESSANVDKNTIGGIGADLSPDGENQAQELLIHLQQHPLPTQKRVFSSPMLRAIRTARILAPGLGIETDQIVMDPRLREIERGDWEGLPRDTTYTDAVKAKMDAMDMDLRAPNGESMSDTACGCANGSLI